jgi:hypothetical protein
MHIIWGLVILFLLFVCCGGPAAVVRFVQGVGCLLLILAVGCALLWVFGIAYNDYNNKHQKPFIPSKERADVAEP